jgi:mxaD protein
MRRTLSLLAFLLAAPAQAHGPTPIKVDETIVIAADPKAVWAVAGKFDGLAAWHPDVQSVKAKGGDAAGAEREVTLKKGGVLKEGLDEYDAVAHKLGWRMSDPNLDAMPASSYSLSFSVESAAGGGSQVKWYGRLYRGDTSNEPPDNLNDDAARTAMAAYLHSGLEGLKKKVEGK